MNTVMDREEKKEEYRKRGYRSCVSSAMRDTLSSLHRTTKGHLLCFVVAAAAVSALYTWMLTLMPGMAYVGFEFKGMQFAVSSLLMVVLAFVVASSLFSMVNGKKVAWNIRRGLKLVPINSVFLILYVVLGAVFCFAYMFTRQNVAEIKLTTLLGLFGLALPLLLVFVLPMIYVNVKYMLEPDSRIMGIFRSSYAVGFRSWGFLFATMFLVSLCIFIADVVICLPAYLLVLIENISAYGIAAYGDSVSLPAAFYIASFFIFLFVSLVRICLQIFFTHTVSYVYQTVEACLRAKSAKGASSVLEVSDKKM